MSFLSFFPEDSAPLVPKTNPAEPGPAERGESTLASDVNKFDSTESRRITVQKFRNLFDTKGVGEFEGGPREVLEHIGVMHPLRIKPNDDAKFGKTKAQAPMFNVATYDPKTPDGENRADGTWQRGYWGVVGDADALTGEQLETFESNLSKRGWLYLKTTSFKHTDAAPRVRYVVPMDRDGTADEYRQGWEALNVLAGGDLDGGAKDPTRRSYFPSCPAGQENTRPPAVIKGTQLATWEELLPLAQSPAMPTAGTTAGGEIGAPFGDETATMFDMVKGDVTPVYDNTPGDFEQIKDECETMRWAAEPANQHDVKRNLWLNELSITTRCEGGDELIHQISEHHPDYDEGKTENAVGSLTGGPALCGTIANSQPEARAACERCQHRGKISTPLQLGKLRRVSAAVVSVVGESKYVRPEVVGLNKRYAVARMGSDVAVVDFRSPVASLSEKGGGVEYTIGYLKVETFKRLLAGQFIELKDAKDEVKKIPLAAWWLGDKHRRQYDGVMFSPGRELPANILNLYTGFAVDAIEGDVSPWLEVLQEVIPNLEQRTYALKWIAWKIQNTGGVPDTVLILTGEKGAGKNSLFDPIGVIFGKHAMFTSSVHLVIGQFNINLMDKCLVVMDEAVFAGNPQEQDRIKSVVTAKSTMYEAKGMTPVQGINYTAFVSLTNHAWTWAATGDERRAAVIETASGLKGRFDVWAKYHTWVKGAGPSALLHYLQGVNLTGFNPRSIPKGEALRRQIELTALRDPSVAWWSNCLSEGRVTYRDGSGERLIELDDTKPTELDRSALRLSYESSVASRRTGAPNWQGVYRNLQGWCGGIEDVRRRRGQTRVRCDVLPPLPTLIERFQTATGVTIG